MKKYFRGHSPFYREASEISSGTAFDGDAADDRWSDPERDPCKDSVLMDVGLDYLTLARATGTLSGGEAQRIRLATQIGSGLVGVAYILDEPSIGLHQRDNDKLLATLKHLRDLGNSLMW